MSTKLLLSTLATAAVLFAAPAFSAEEKAKADGKEHVHCDPAKDKNCKDEHIGKNDGHGHKPGDKHESKDDHSEKDGHDHGKKEEKKQ